MGYFELLFALLITMKSQNRSEEWKSFIQFLQKPNWLTFATETFSDPLPAQSRECSELCPRRALSSAWIMTRGVGGNNMPKINFLPIFCSTGLVGRHYLNEIHIFWRSTEYRHHTKSTLFSSTHPTFLTLKVVGGRCVSEPVPVTFNFHGRGNHSLAWPWLLEGRLFLGRIHEWPTLLFFMRFEISCHLTTCTTNTILYSCVARWPLIPSMCIVILIPIV